MTHFSYTFVLCLFLKFLQSFRFFFLNEIFGAFWIMDWNSSRTTIISLIFFAEDMIVVLRSHHLYRSTHCWGIDPVFKSKSSFSSIFIAYRNYSLAWHPFNLACIWRGYYFTVTLSTFILLNSSFDQQTQQDYHFKRTEIFFISNVIDWSGLSERFCCNCNSFPATYFVPL